jgi:hypothetical protein
MSVVGLLSFTAPGKEPQLQAAFRPSLSERGFIEGRNVAIELGAAVDPVLCSVCPVLCPVVLVFDGFGLTRSLFIQALRGSEYPRFSFVIPVVVGSNPIRHPIPLAILS